MIYWKGKVIVSIQSKTRKLPPGVGIDVLIIGNNSMRFSDLQKTKSSPRLIILDSSNSYFYTDHFVKQGAYSGLTIYSVKHQGAYEEYI